MEQLEERCCLAAAVVLSDYEQLLLELVNRTRANPAGEAARYGVDLNQGLPAGTITATPKQPLAPNQALVNAAESHSQDMLDRDFFDHNNPSGQTPFDRIEAFGYGPYIGAVENIGWGGTTGPLNTATAVDERNTALFRSPEHCQNMLRTTPKEIGTGVRFGVFTNGGVNWNASMVTEDIALRAGDGFLTGVAYTDAVVHDQFYSLGEAIGGATITAVNSSTGASFTTQSGPSGGYALQVPAGTYTVTANAAALGGNVVITNVALGTDNVKVDFVPGLRTATPPTIADIGNLSTNEDASLGPIAITVASADFATTQLTVSASSSNAALIPNANLALGGSGGSRTLVITPVANQFGTATITVTVADPGGLTASDSFVITVVPVDDPPSIAPIGDQYIVTSGSRAVGLAVQDVDTPAAQLSVTATSSNEDLLPASSLSITGTGTTRTLLLSPVSGQQGAATITVRVDDGNLQTTTSFSAWVLANPFPWYNAARPLDANANGRIEPLDALLIINYLNAGLPTKILPTAQVGGGPGFLDTNADNEIAPLDALLVINGLNAQESGVGSQGSGVGGEESLLALLAVDAAASAARRRTS